MSGYREFRDGWKVVLAATVGIGTGLTTVVFYTIGVFVKTLVEEFGWTDHQIMVSVTIVLLGAAALSPLVGMLADRIGARRVALASVTGLGLSWTLLAFGNGSLALFYASFAWLTIVGTGTLPVTWTRAVINRFTERRGLALGICLVGTGIFGTIIKLYTYSLIATAGWRIAYACVGLILLFVTLPVTFFFFHDVPRNRESATTDPAAGLSLGQAVLTRQFWTLSACFLLLSLSIAGIGPNLERYMSSRGFEYGTAVKIAAFHGPGVIFGRVLTGWLIDRFWAPFVVFLVLLASVITYVLLGVGPLPALWVPMAYVFVLGTAAGAEYDALAYLTSRYFGTKAYSAIYGTIFVSFAIGAGLAPYAFSRAFAVRQSYEVLLIATAAVLLIAASGLLTLGRYPDVRPAVPVPAGTAAAGTSVST